MSQPRSFQIIIKNETSIDDLREETKNIEEIAPKDIESVISKMTGSEIHSVFKNSTVRQHYSIIQQTFIF